MNKNELFRIKLYDDFIKLRDKLNLSPMQKEIFVMRFNEQLLVIQICMRLHISESKYYSEINKILKKVSGLSLEDILNR